MPLKPGRITLTTLLLIGSVPAIASAQISVNSIAPGEGGIPNLAEISRTGSILSPGLPSSIPNGGWGASSSLPTGVWDILQSQTGNPSDYESIFTGGGIPNGGWGGSSSLPTGVWDILQSQTGIPSDYRSIFTGGGIPQTLPQDIFSILQPELGIPSEYGDILGTVLGTGSLTGSSPFGGGTTPPFTGFAPGGLSGSSRKIPTKPASNLPPELTRPTGQQNPVQVLGQTVPNIGGVLGGLGENISDKLGGFQIPQLPNINPFGGILEWSKNTPIARVLGSISGQIRGFISNPSFGFFTQNSVVKARDQANLYDQELARVFADSRLGEKGELWMAQEVQETTAVLTTGLNSANIAIQIAQESQALTSTQDVAKAVAQQGGQTAALSASILQMQGENQSSLLQLQQMTAAAMQVAADSSEGLDEANRRERLERSTALRDSASQFIYIPGVFDSPAELSGRTRTQNP